MGRINSAEIDLKTVYTSTCSTRARKYTTGNKKLKYTGVYFPSPPSFLRDDFEIYGLDNYEM